MKNPSSIFATMLLMVLSPTVWAQTKFTLAVKENKVLWKASYIVQDAHEGTVEITSRTIIMSIDGMITKTTRTMAHPPFMEYQHIISKKF